VKHLPLRVFAGLMYLFLFGPIVLVLVNSFNADPNLVEWSGFTGRWYRQAMSEDVVVDGIKNSLLIALTATTASVVGGTLAAIAVRNVPGVVRAATDASTYARLVMPEIVLAVGLLLTFRALGYQLGFVTVIVAHTSLYTAYVILIVSARLSRRDRFTEEAARDLGATAWRTMLRVTLPEAAPAMATAGVLIFTFSMDNVISSLFLSSGLNTLPLVLFSMIHTHITPEVNALGGMLSVLPVAAFAVFALARGIRRRRSQVTQIVVEVSGR